MKKNAVRFLLLLVNEFSFGQNQCKYKKSLKFKSDDTRFSTEQGGLFKNAHILAPRSFQLEVNSLASSYPNEYTSQVLALISQWRYGIRSGYEIHTGFSIIEPIEIRSDTLYYGHFEFGLKKRVFSIERQALNWEFSVMGSYIFQIPEQEEYGLRHGLSFSGNNTWLFYRIVNFDLVLGSFYFPFSNKFQPYMSSHILIKDEGLKVGLFLSFCGNQYLENLGTLGIHFTNNRNLILQISLGYFDKVISPNVTFTYLFNEHIK